MSGNGANGLAGKSPADGPRKGVEQTVGFTERFDKINPGRLFRNKKYRVADAGGWPRIGATRPARPAGDQKWTASSRSKPLCVSPMRAVSLPRRWKRACRR